MKPTGTQFVAEFFNCTKDILNDQNALEQILSTGITQCGVGLISINSHCYDPIGVTSIAVISESHVAIHTYPEARHASIDIFTCSRDSEVSFRILEFLKERLDPGTTRIAEISRGNPIEITNKNWITDDTGSHGFDIRYHIEEDLHVVCPSIESVADCLADEIQGVGKIVGYFYELLCLINLRSEIVL